MIEAQLLATARILIVDDEVPNVLLLERVLAKAGCEFLASTTNSLEAVPLAREFKPDLILLDLHMPKMDGFAVLAELQPLLAKNFLPVLVLTADTTAEAMRRALSSGAKDFLTKPLDAVEVVLRISNLLETRFLYDQERLLLEETLQGSIEALMDVMALVTPAAFSRASRAKEGVTRFLHHLEIESDWEVGVAALLSQLGSVSLPPETVEKVYFGKKLTHAETVAVKNISQVSSSIISKVPRMGRVADILRCQDLQFDGRGSGPDDPRGEDIPWGARVLKLVLDRDVLESRGIASHLVLEPMRERKGWYDPELFDALAQLSEIERLQKPVVEIDLIDLREGMVLAEDVVTNAGMLFVARGHEVSYRLMERLHNSASLFDRNHRVHIVRGNSSDIEVPQDSAEVECPDVAGQLN